MPPENPEDAARAHDRAARLLHSAEERLTAARDARDAHEGTPLERDDVTRVSEASAAVATKEEWLHWVDHHESTRPEADGEWGPEPTPDMPPRER
jgi:hypothetical protein